MAMLEIFKSTPPVLCVFTDFEPLAVLIATFPKFIG
jgi:hypothetical protein